MVQRYKSPNNSDSMLFTREHYVYVLFRETGVPFYVGLGKEARWEVHEKYAKRGRSHRDNIIVSMRDRGFEVPKVKVREGLTKKEAAEIEIALIAVIGREPIGPLINQTSGGEGVHDLSPETLKRKAAATSKKMRGVPHSPEHSAAIRQARNKPESKKKTSAAAKRMWDAVPKEERAARVPSTKGCKRTAEQREAMRHRVVSQVTREKQRLAHKGKGKGHPVSNETRRKIAVALTGRKASAETCAKIKAAQENRSESAVINLRAAAKRRWEDPAEHERYREIGRKAAAARWSKVKAAG